MALVSDALCTIDDVKEYYYQTDSGDMPSSGALDDLIESFINQITELFESFCAVDSFKAADYTEYVDGNDTQYIFVKNKPVNSITSINVDADWAFGSDTELDSDTYRIADSRYIVRKDYVFSEGTQNVEIKYNAGYSIIPLDLKMVAVEEVVRRLKYRKSLEVASKSNRDQNVTYVTPTTFTSFLMLFLNRPV